MKKGGDDATFRKELGRLRSGNAMSLLEHLTYGSHNNEPGFRCPFQESQTTLNLATCGRARSSRMVIGNLATTTSEETTSTIRQAELFQLLCNSLPDAVLLADTNGKILHVNNQTEKLFGYSRTELLGKPIEILIPERFRTSHAKHRSAYNAQPRVRPMGTGLELYAERKDGSEFPVDIMLTPVNTDDGWRVVAVVRDLRGQRSAEHAIQEGRLLERICESSPDAILLIARPEGTIIRANAEAEKISGYRRDELVGRPVEDLLGPDGRHRFRPIIHRVDEPLERSHPTLELNVEQKSGCLVPVEVTYDLVVTNDGEMILAVVRDVTARKQAEDALRRSEQRLRSIVENVRGCAIFTLSPEGRVESWSPAAERTVGYSDEEILGRHFSQFYLPKDVQRGKPEQLLKLAAVRGRVEDEGWQVRKDGSRFWSNVVITPLRDTAGNIEGYIKVTRDFTARKRAEETLLLEITNVLVSNKEVSGLLSAISASLKKVVPHDSANLALYDSKVRKLRLNVLESSPDLEVDLSDEYVPLQGTPSGLCFSSQQPLVLDRLDPERFPSARVKELLAAGIKSACLLPLAHRAKTLGVLAIGSTKEGAFAGANLTLLSQVANQVALAIDNADTFSQLSNLNKRLLEEKRYLEDELRTKYCFEDILGEEPALKNVLKQVETVAPTDATVLILGETGTGKELIARAIHDISSRRERTFVKLNCAAIPAGLLESELFGHERGAFTGATSQKIGRLELAHGGTLFLDEVGDIPLELQPKLLRALQEKEFERLGSTRTISVEVRLIAATNRDLAQMVADGQFRSDLFYRLNVFPLQVPPLRKRKKDIPLLVHHFVDKYAHGMKVKKNIETIPPKTMEVLQRWHWPGNVRELENFIERAVILSPGTVLRAPLSELALTDETEEKPPKVSTLAAAERELIVRALRETKGVVAGPKGAAALLGLKRTTLLARMRKLGISAKHI